MINFMWNNIRFEITDIGGGKLENDIPRHFHASNSYELHFITGGKGKLITDTKEYELEKDNFFVTGPNIYHEQLTDKSSPVEDVFVTLQADNIKKSNAVSAVFLDTRFCFVEKFKNKTAVKMLEEYRAKRLDYTSAVAALCTLLLTDIARATMPDITNCEAINNNLNERRFIIIEQAFLYDKDITLSSLSEKIGLCERQTQRLLKKYYSQTFREKKKEITK